MADALEHRGEVRVLAGELPGEKRWVGNRLRVVPGLACEPKGAGAERFAFRGGVPVFAVSRCIGSSIAMIDQELREAL
jgi:hypothetical protein